MTSTFRTLFFLGLSFALACGDNDRRAGDGGPRLDTSSDVSAADAGPSDPRCPATTVITGFACDVDSIGAMCAGSVSCACAGGDFRTGATSCECREGGAGRTYYCEDDCTGICPSADAGTRDAGTSDAGRADAGTATTCSRYCQLAESNGCAPANCTADCETSLTEPCGVEFEAFLACINSGPVMCGDGILLPAEGCDAEQQDLINCAS